MRAQIILLLIFISVVPNLHAQETAAEPASEAAVGTAQSGGGENDGSVEDAWYAPVLEAGYQVFAAVLVAALGGVGIYLRSKIKELSQAKRKLQLLLPPTIDDPLDEANSRYLITAIMLGKANSGKTELIGSLVGSHKKRVRSESVNRHYGVWGVYYNPNDPNQNLDIEPGAKAVRESYWLDLFDSVGQDFGQIINHLVNPNISYSKQVILVVVVDLFAGPVEEEKLEISDEPDKKRIGEHLARFDEQFVEQFRGVLGEVNIQQVILFVNKVDGIRDREHGYELKKEFSPIRQAFTKFGFPVHTIVGSALRGDGMVELAEMLRSSAEKIDG